MRVRVYIIIPLIIIQNVGYAKEIVFNVENSITASNKAVKQEKSVKADILTRLVDKGLEKEEVEKLLNDKPELSNLKLSKLMNILQGISHDDMIEVLSKRVLFRQCIDLNNKDTLLAIAQQMKGVNISGEIYNSLRELAS